jgi:hypothetical protein
LRQVRDGAGFGATKPGTEVIPEGDGEPGGSFHETEEGITTITPEIAARAAADLALSDLAADGVFGAIGMQRDLRPVEGHQQFGFFGMEPSEQPVEAGKAGAALENAVEAGSTGFRGICSQNCIELAADPDRR